MVWFRSDIRIPQSGFVVAGGGFYYNYIHQGNKRFNTFFKRWLQFRVGVIPRLQYVFLIKNPIIRSVVDRFFSLIIYISCFFRWIYVRISWTKSYGFETLVEAASSSNFGNKVLCCIKSILPTLHLSLQKSINPIKR